METIDSVYIILAIVFSAFILYQEALYRVKEDDQVIIDWFGNVSVKTVPGVYFKIPFIQKTHHFPKNLNISQKNDQCMSTVDNKMICLDTRAQWKIDDVAKFYNRLVYLRVAEDILWGKIVSAEKRIVSSLKLSDIVIKSINQTEDNTTCNSKFLSSIQKEARSGLEEFGILLLNIDVSVTSPSQRPPA